MDSTYAKVLLLQGTVQAFQQRLQDIAGPDIDATVLQVGKVDVVVRARLLEHLRAHTGGTAEAALMAAGAAAVVPLTQDEAAVLYDHRTEFELQKRPKNLAPDWAGGKSWHLEMVNAAGAWAAVGGAGQINWSGVVVGQLDTGYTQHKALGFGAPGPMWLDQAKSATRMIDNSAPQQPLPQLIRQPGAVDKMPFGSLFKGHGTRIGSTISGFHKAGSSVTFSGMAPKVPHVVVRITDSVGLNTSQYAFEEGLDYLVNAGVDIVNVSLGTFPTGVLPAVRQAVTRAYNAGVILICAAGNKVDPVVAPANLPETIAVGGITWKDLAWGESSYGPEVDFCAPSAAIYRPVAVKSGIGSAYEGGGEGTSYATAITTGCAALWLQRWGPQIAQKYGKTSKRVDAFRKAAVASCRMPATWDPQNYGAGVIDATKLCTNQALALP